MTRSQRSLLLLSFLVFDLNGRAVDATSNAVASTRGSDARYSGCNAFGTCNSLHRPEFVRVTGTSVLRLQPDQCLPLLAFVRCAIYKMACRTAIRNDLIVQVPCQASCEQALGACRRYVHEDRAWDHLQLSDCRFLPAGGCLDWTSSGRRRPNHRIGSFGNVFCQGVLPPCNRMFPARFRRRDWRQGNFSIVVDILIKSVMWFFQGRQVHSYLTAEVRRVFKSNIGLERGLQHTIQWPSTCYCPGQILVGHRYYLLAHSIERAHEFNVSVNSVFLPKLKRYRRRLLCWISRRCGRKNRRGDRKRRRRSTNFRVWN